MSDNKIYEIARQMSDRNIIKEDLNEASNLVMNMFKEKYVNKFQREIIKKQANLYENPSKELQLMMSIKNFMEPKGKENMEQLISTFALCESLDLFNNSTVTKANIPPENLAHKPNNTRVNISSEATKATASFNDSSIHNDGIYDVDNVCISNRKPSMNSPLNSVLMLLMLSQGISL